MSSTPFGSGSFGDEGLGTEAFYNTSSTIDTVLRATNHTNPSTATNQRAVILKFINNRYQEIVLGSQWRWLRDTVDFSLLAPYNTGTATAVNGSNIITGIGTTWDATMIGNMFWFTNRDTTYRVRAVNSPTELQLESKYAEDSQSETAYKILRTTYKIPKEASEILSISVGGNYSIKIPLVGVDDMRATQARNPTLSDQPRSATILRYVNEQFNPVTNYYFEFYPAPDRSYNSRLDYMKKIEPLTDATSSYSLIPDIYSAILYYGALADFYLYMKDPESAQVAEGKFSRMLFSMRNDRQMIDQDLVMVSGRQYLARSRYHGLRGTVTAEEFGRWYW